MAATEQGGRRAPRPFLRLAGFLVLFLACTGLGLWWAMPDWPALRAARDHFLSLSGWTHATLLTLAVALIAAEMIRLVVLGRALDQRVGFWAALDATIANNFFSWITPGVGLGEPAATYMLGRHGVPWDAAVLIAFGKFALSFAFIFGLGFVMLALGFGPPIPRWVVVPIATAVGLFTLLLLALIVGAFWPTWTTAGIARVERSVSATRLGRSPRATRVIGAVCRTVIGTVDRLSRFRRAGVAHWLAIVASQVIYHAVFLAILITLAAAFRAGSIAPTVPTAIVYQCFLFLAPTPGSSGLGEASADLFFGQLLPGGAAFTVVVLYRALTTYLHVAIGLIYLPIVGGLREMLAGKRGS